MACLWKQWWSHWQNPAYTAVKFFFTTFTAVLLGSLSWDLGGRHELQLGAWNNTYLNVNSKSRSFIRLSILIPTFQFIAKRAKICLMRWVRCSLQLFPRRSILFVGAANSMSWKGSLLQRASRWHVFRHSIGSSTSSCWTHYMYI